MRIPSHPSYVLRMLQHRLKKLATASPVVAATFGQYTHRCGRPQCRCYHGGPLHVGQHLTFKENGKPVKEGAATFTLVLQKGTGGWLITAWSWAKS